MKRICLLPRFLKKSMLMLIGVSMACLPAVKAEAQARTHDGFFLQMDLGAGGMASTADSGGYEFEVSGVAGQFSIAVGGAIKNNLILAGRAWAVAAEDPTLEVDGADYGEADATVTLSGIGLDVTYYLPSNVYFSATPSLTTLTVESDGDDYDTDTGFGLRLAVGKEWWVSENWGLGLNGQAILSTNDDHGDTWTSAWVGIAFSATFN